MRAAMASSAAFQTLANLGLLDTLTYCSGLSGSSWYLTSLYAKGNFMQDQTLFHQAHDNIIRITTQDGLTGDITKGDFVWNAVSHVWNKRKDSNTVSFTDIFGQLIGNEMLRQDKTSKFSDQQDLVLTGTVPFPVMTAISVKATVPDHEFNEWYEFSPFEVGTEKYGLYMKTEEFGGIFYMGNLVKNHLEMPLCLLLGIMGSGYAQHIKTLTFYDHDTKMIKKMQEESEQMSSAYFER